MRRYLATFYRNPFLFALPLLVLTAIGLAVAVRAARNVEPYTAEGTLAVNLDPTRTRPLGELPPADHHADLLGELIESDTFLNAALERTSLHPDPTLRSIDRDLAREVRRNWRQRADGPNTVVASYRCDDPGLCAEIVAAVLATYQDEVTSARVSPRRAAVEFYERQLRASQQRLLGLSETSPGYVEAREAVDTLDARLSNARLEEGLDREARQAELRVLSPPQVPETRGGGLRAAALPLLASVLLGLALSAVMVVFATWMDGSVRSPDDVFERLGIPVLAVIPRTAVATGAGPLRPAAVPQAAEARSNGRGVDPVQREEKADG